MAFKAEEILDPNVPFLDLEMDPKLSWALRNLDQFGESPDCRIPDDFKNSGIGVKTAQKIVSARRFQILTMDHLKNSEQL